MLVLVLSCLMATVSLFLDILMFMLFLRAVISWFPQLSDSRFGVFLFTVTEWVITPVRNLLEKMGFDALTVIDIPFFVTFILLSVVSSII